MSPRDWFGIVVIIAPRDDRPATPNADPVGSRGASSRGAGVSVGRVSSRGAMMTTIPDRARWSPLSEDQIHDPAPANVRSVAATVIEDVGVVAACVLERVGEDLHRAELPRLV